MERFSASTRALSTADYVRASYQSVVQLLRPVDNYPAQVPAALCCRAHSFVVILDEYHLRRQFRRMAKFVAVGLGILLARLIATLLCRSRRLRLTARQPVHGVLQQHVA